MAVFIGCYALQYVLMLVLAFTIGASSVMLPTSSPNTRPDITGIMVMNVFQFASALVILPVQYGLQWQALKVVRGEQAGWRDVFHGYRNLFGLLGLTLLTGIIVTLGYILCIVPGLLASGITLFAPLLLIDKSIGPVEAIETCFRVFRPHMWMSIVFLIVYTLLGAVGAVLCCVGMIFTYPIFTVAIAYHYNLFFPPIRYNETAIGSAPPA